ncbi:acyl-CoA N-acyltransferase [Aureobasidium subglaciale]|nr:acyl-CoA N-acyltransferase [Aureobasidium subglaciale]
MPVKIRPFQASDLLARERIFKDAFSAGLRPHIYPNGTTDADLIHNFDENIKGLATKMSSSDTQAGQRFFVAYDTETSAPTSDLEFPANWDKKNEVELKGKDREEAKRIVGIAIWQLQPAPRTQEEIDKEAAEGQSHAHAPSANGPLLDAFGKALTAGREKWIGLDAYLYLKVLAIDPTYQRRGVGSLLLDEGLAVADRVGIKAYLEATEVGRPLYQRKGFVDRELVDFDVARYAPAAKGERHDFMCMIRPAPEAGKKAQGSAEEGEGHGGTEAVVEKGE